MRNLPRLIDTTVLKYPAAVLAAAYGCTLHVRNTLYDRIPALSSSLPFPVVSVGAIHAGGSGKTPLAALVGTYLTSRGKTVCFLSRGYGRTGRRTLVAAPGEHARWQDIGDEPAMLRRCLPQAWMAVGPNRLVAGKAAASRLPPGSVFVMDDGFQHRRLRRSCDIVLLPPSTLSSRLIPRGTLREKVSAVARARIICCTGAETEHDSRLQLRARLEPRFGPDRIVAIERKNAGWCHFVSEQTQQSPPAERCILVCGIARPGNFIHSVKAQGICPEATFVFPDHHRFTRSDIQRFMHHDPRCILTTYKDAIRLCGISGIDPNALWFGRLKLIFPCSQDKSLFFTILDRCIE